MWTNLEYVRRATSHYSLHNDPSAPVKEVGTDVDAELLETVLARAHNEHPLLLLAQEQNLIDDILIAKAFAKVSSSSDILTHSLSLHLAVKFLLE